MFKWNNRIIFFLCYLPYLHLLLYYAFIVRAIIKVGAIPSYGNPDPKELGFTTHRELVYRSADVVAVGICLLLIMYLITYFWDKINVRRVHLRAGLIGAGLFVFTLFGPFAEWFAD